MPFRVLFVCLGNICRSPLAEGAFRHQAKRLGLDVEADSAATRDWHMGSPPDRRSIAVAKGNGVDISKQRARALTEADFAAFTHILGMDSANLEAIRRMAPAGHSAHLSLLLDHAAGGPLGDIADPWAGRAAAFEQTWQEVNLGVSGLIETLVKGGKPD